MKIRNKDSKKFSQLEEIMREQQNELTALRTYIAQLHGAQTAGVAPAIPTPSKIGTNNRRKMLKRLGLAVLAGGAALGITASTYSPAEAKLSVNPSSNVGAIVTRNGASLTGILSTQRFGLLASPDDTTDITSLVEDSNYIGVAGFASDNGISSLGVFGYSSNGTGVGAYSPSGIGLSGQSGTNIAIYANNFSTTNSTIQVVNDNSQGYALEINKGGLKVTGAGIGTQTTVFIHLAKDSNIANNVTTLDNNYTNNKPNAILLVTPVFNPHGSNSGIDDIHPVGVKYEAPSWKIYHTDGVAITPNTSFNVLVVNP